MIDEKIYFVPSSEKKKRKLSESSAEEPQGSKFGKCTCFMRIENLKNNDKSIFWLEKALSDECSLKSLTEESRKSTKKLLGEVLRRRQACKRHAS